MTPEELRAIEQQVNEKIWEALEVETVETDIDTAKEMGAMALFGEKYGKEVRVVTIGDYSIELYVVVPTLATLLRLDSSRLSKKKVLDQELAVSWR